MVRCSVMNCKNDSMMKVEGLSFHSFPTKPELRNMWINATGRLHWSPKPNARICKQHFDQNDLLKRKIKTNLRRNSVPKFKLPRIPKLPTPSTTSEGPLTNAGDIKDIIARVYNYLQAEYLHLKSSLDAHCDLSPLENILARTAAATGVSEHAVSAILEERKRSADEDLLLDDGPAKRAKFTCDGGENVSPITDDESTWDAPCEEQDEVTDQDKDNEQTDDDSEEQDECRLKMEIKIEDENEPFDLLQLQMNEMESAVGHVISSTYNSCPDSDTIVRKPVRVKIEPDMVDTESKPKVVPTISPQVQLRGSAFEVTRVACDNPYTPVDVIPHSSGASTSDMVMDVKIEPDVP